MISKETFCKALNLIKEQDETNRKFSDALKLVGDGYFLFGADNQYLNALLMVMKESVDDKYDYIEWWLYDAAEDHRIWNEDESKEWNLTDPAALYDFIRDECH